MGPVNSANEEEREDAVSREGGKDTRVVSKMAHSSLYSALLMTRA